SFTFVLMGESGNDYAYWRDSEMGVVTYQGGGAYVNRIWEIDGAARRARSAAEAVAPPNAQGEWSVVSRHSAPGPDAMPVEYRTTYAFARAALSVEVEARPAGTQADFQVVLAGDYQRAP
ncbi:MAG: hypothetical protein MI723_07380, partial [Caulobacterales bacterium]|nr:hypothetical protein [Caulobacterales bacterium]